MSEITRETREHVINAKTLEGQRTLMIQRLMRLGWARTHLRRAREACNPVDQEANLHLCLVLMVAAGHGIKMTGSKCERKSWCEVRGYRQYLCHVPDDQVEKVSQATSSLAGDEAGPNDEAAGVMAMRVETTETTWHDGVVNRKFDRASDPEVQREVEETIAFLERNLKRERDALSEEIGDRDKPFGDDVEYIESIFNA